MALQITAVYFSLSGYWDKEARGLLANGDYPIDFDHLYSTARFRDHEQLLEIAGPAIIIAGSGMCSGGRIVDHLRTGLADTKNDILFVGYQARGILGREIHNQVRQPRG